MAQSRPLHHSRVRGLCCVHRPLTLCAAGSGMRHAHLINDCSAIEHAGHERYTCSASKRTCTPPQPQLTCDPSFRVPQQEWPCKIETPACMHARLDVSHCNSLLFYAGCCWNVQWGGVGLSGSVHRAPHHASPTCVCIVEGGEDEVGKHVHVEHGGHYLHEVQLEGRLKVCQWWTG